MQSLIDLQQWGQSSATRQGRVLTMGEERVLLSLAEAAVFPSPSGVLTLGHLLRSQAQVLPHMKLVEQDSGLWNRRLGRLTEGFPHVHHRPLNPLSLSLAQLSVEHAQAFREPIAAAKPDGSPA